MLKLDSSKFQDATLLWQDGLHIVYGDYVFTVIAPAFSPEKLSVWLTKRGIARACYCFSAAKGTIAEELVYQLSDPDRRQSYINMFEAVIESSHG